MKRVRVETEAPAEAPGGVEDEEQEFFVYTVDPQERYLLVRVVSDGRLDLTRIPDVLVTAALRKALQLQFGEMGATLDVDLVVWDARQGMCVFRTSRGQVRAVHGGIACMDLPGHPAVSVQRVSSTLLGVSHSSEPGFPTCRAIEMQGGLGSVEPYNPLHGSATGTSSSKLRPKSL